jgi:hypothetical protein
MPSNGVRAGQLVIGRGWGKGKGKVWLGIHVYDKQRTFSNNYSYQNHPNVFVWYVRGLPRYWLESMEE